MIQFNKNENFTISVTGGKEEYKATIGALLDAITFGTDDISEESRYRICELIRGMIPDTRELLNMDEVEEFERVKSQNVELVKEIIK